MREYGTSGSTRVRNAHGPRAVRATAALAVLLVAAGCRRPCGDDATCDPGALCVRGGCEVVPPQGEPQTVSYVVTDIAIPEPAPRTRPSTPGVAAGFDLDGLVTISDVTSPSCVAIV